MQYRLLHGTDMSVSVIGFGGIPLQRVNFREAEAVLLHALDQGVNFIDTSRVYTDSEQKIGQVLKMRRQDVFIASKSPVRSGKQILAQVEQSLKDLRVDRIDLYQLHNVKDLKALDEVLAPDGALAGLQEARFKGLIRFIGITGHISSVLAKAIKTRHFATVQFPFNPLEREGAQELLPLANGLGVGAIAMKPLAGGALVNPTAALKWILSHPVDVAIPGMDRLEQVTENALVGQSSLVPTSGELQMLEKEIATLGRRFCRRCEYCLPCPQGIDIPSVFLFEGYYSRYGLQDWAASRYHGMPAKVSDCAQCGECEEKCPYRLPVRKMLAESAELLEKV